MKHWSITTFAAVCILAALLLTSVRAHSPAKTVTGSGCIKAGVEAGCLVLKDTKTGTLYNLFFKMNSPGIGTAIRFTGTRHRGATTCMQGTAVDVTEFTVITMRCS